jgi:hypothetical protein
MPIVAVIKKTIRSLRIRGWSLVHEPGFLCCTATLDVGIGSTWHVSLNGIERAHRLLTQPIAWRWRVSKKVAAIRVEPIELLENREFHRLPLEPPQRRLVATDGPADRRGA